jgi:hypothetical protein
MREYTPDRSTSGRLSSVKLSLNFVSLPHSKFCESLTDFPSRSKIFGHLTVHSTMDYWTTQYRSNIRNSFKSKNVIDATFSENAIAESDREKGRQMNTTNHCKKI